MSDNDNDQKPPYRVGYGKPPKEHQFKAGNRASGNRRRKSSTQGNLLREILLESVLVTKNGRRSEISAIEAIFWRTTQSAMSGNSKALDQIFKHIKEFERLMTFTETAPHDYGADVRAKLNQMAERLKAQKENGG